MRHFVMLVFALGSSVALFAQAGGGANPLVGTSKGTYGRIKDVVLRSAEKMPEENFSFQPTPEVRTYGQLLGHIAGAQYLFCGTVSTGKPERKDIEKTVTTKAGLTAALKEAFAYCDSVYEKTTDAGAAEMVGLFGRQMTKLGVLDMNIAHSFEHYGNLVTYMRMKKLVPPSSEGRR
ncbi:MAG: DinB family protein [Acidobacteria bacterium]|nr:DinB family protein [Acidobacteriota bacterium]